MTQESGRSDVPIAAVRLVAAAVAEGAVPGAVLAVGRGRARARPLPWMLYCAGRTRVGPEGRAVTADTIFDLASLTKVVATTPCVLRLADAGELDLDAPIVRYLPEFGRSDRRAEVTPRHLLTHTSGLPAHRLLYELPGGLERRRAAVFAEPLATPPGTSVCYSDLGYILLGEIVAKLTGTSLDAAARELVFDPLGMAETGYLPTAPPERYAATEPRPDTGLARIGAVHDENAEALGGVAGHAGVFGTVGDLVRYLRDGWLAEDSPILTPRIRREALRCQTAAAGDGHRGLGWTLAGDRWDHMTAAWPHGRAGHTGFTGTSLALDPVGGLWTVLLTNAVHLGRDHSGIIALRRTVHAAVAAWAAATDLGGNASGSTDADTVTRPCTPVAGYDRAVEIQGDR
ncbi:beta-lactamase family protein [Actinospica durhamensis]|uniref:Beta-lactamase family protein n=1 Tax=Actinospica durhamensis TaxID=1508375 RepID=A0A941IN45_9ACTN|nr:serine hydrolase domain-containing protein [Actinospica durhamensis]MBR7834990.1 beta-lactamase family protein [Actinospica durhamensis]